MRRLSGIQVAVKVMMRRVEGEALEDFRKEVGICSKIFHPNIVLFLGCAHPTQRTQRTQHTQHTAHSAESRGQRCDLTRVQCDDNNSQSVDDRQRTHEV